MLSMLASLQEKRRKRSRPQVFYLLELRFVNLIFIEAGSESPRLMIDETELKEEVEVKEEPEELPEPSEPEQTPKEQPKALTKQQIELQEALLLMEQEDYSEGSDVEDYY